MRPAITVALLLIISCTNTAPVASVENPVRVGAGTGIRAPRVIRHVEPLYSERDRAARIEGVTRMEVLVDTNGSPREVTVLDAPGAGLGADIAAAVRKWQWEPLYVDGKPTPFITTVIVNMRLN